jgi:hypothetical protein
LHDPETKARLKSQILSVAKSLLAGQTGVIAASRQLSRYWSDVEPELDEFLIGFVGINSETDALPIGEVRQHWSPEALERKDHEIAEAEDLYREGAMKDANRLVQLLEGPSRSCQGRLSVRPPRDQMDYSRQ